MDGIDDAERAHLIVAANDDPEPASPSPAGSRQTLVSSLSLPPRHQLHLGVTEVIERVYAPSLDGPNGGHP